MVVLTSHAAKMPDLKSLTLEGLQDSSFYQLAAIVGKESDWSAGQSPVQVDGSPVGTGTF